MITLTEAAKQLGLTKNALEQRIRRGVLTGEKREGIWYVQLPELTTDKVLTCPETRGNTRICAENADLVPLTIEEGTAGLDYLLDEMQAALLLHKAHIDKLNAAVVHQGEVIEQQRRVILDLMERTQFLEVERRKEAGNGRQSSAGLVASLTGMFAGREGVRG